MGEYKDGMATFPIWWWLAQVAGALCWGWYIRKWTHKCGRCSD